MSISLSKFYKTVEGKPVSLHTVTGKGSFPVKGSVYRPHRGYHNNPEYCMWTRDGSFGMLFTTNDDLVEVTEDEFMLLIGAKE